MWCLKAATGSSTAWSPTCSWARSIRATPNCRTPHACRNPLPACWPDQTLYTNLEVLPALMLERGPEPGSPDYDRLGESDHQDENTPRPLPIKTVPAHHAVARLASAGDVAEIFGDPECQRLIS